MAYRRHAGDRYGTPQPQTVRGYQVEGDQDRDGRAADVDSDQRTGPIDSHWNDVAHSEDGDLFPRQNLPRGQLDKRDVEVAPDKRADQHQEGAPRSEAHAQIGVA
jgi:hypothetical protein